MFIINQKKIGTALLARIIFLLLILTFISGCRADEEVHVEPAPVVEIDRYEGEASEVISSVYTTEKQLSLTFNGMANEETMHVLLDELDKYGIKAAFFLPGMRVAEEPDIAREIVARGHEIENNTLNQFDISNLNYEQIYKEVQLSNDVILEKTGVTPRFVRTRSGDYNDELRLIAAQLEMDGVASYTVNLSSESVKENAEQREEYILRSVSRGSIISLNVEEDKDEEVLAMLASVSKEAEEIGYSFVPLSELVAIGKEKKPLADIEGHDLIKVNLDYEQVEPNLFYAAKTNEKVISLTFDDWGSDRTITKVLDILAEHDVKATFFPVGRGVETNPNLARAIIEEGHEVASHSYNHKVVTTMTPSELQEDLVQAHKALTEAIQEQPTMLFRPPTGEIDIETAKVITAAGYPDIAMYDVTVFDWNPERKAEVLIEAIMERADRGSVILLHILDDIHTVEALPTVIERLQQQGYRFMTMTEIMDHSETKGEDVPRW